MSVRRAEDECQDEESFVGLGFESARTQIADLIESRSRLERDDRTAEMLMRLASEIRNLEDET